MTTDKLIYLDYNSTTPVDPRVMNVMLPYFTEHFGNASSRNHPFGWKAEAAVNKARKEVAESLGVYDKEVIFTSGATEGVNLAIKGVFDSYYKKGNHIITLKTEHKAVLDVCERIEKQGGVVTYLDVDKNGLLSLDKLEKAITNKTILVSVMWANNETGVLQPIAEIGELCKKYNVLFISDATQAVGKIPVRPRNCNVDILVCSAHKLYGPKGVGALYISNKSPKVKISPLFDGGGHERNIRSGTLNVPGIVGLGAAIRIAENEMLEEQAKLSKMRDYLEIELLKVEESYLNNNTENRLGHVTNISFKYVESESIISSFHQKLSLSTGSACTSATLEPSHVLSAQGLSDHLAHSALRVSLGRYTTLEEVETAIKLIKLGVAKVRETSPIWGMYKEGVDVDELI